MVKLVRNFFLFIFFVIIFLPESLSQEKIRIMPMGNSITYGNMCLNGSIYGCQPIGGTRAAAYRDRLMDLLTQSGYNVDFVGSQKSGSYYLTDTDHAGFGGITDDKLADVLETGYSQHTGRVTDGPYLDHYPADIILLHIGTNDVLRVDTGNMNGLERILNAIDSYETRVDKNVTVFLAKIISYRYYDCNTQPVVKAYNRKIEEIVTRRKALGDDLILVDMECDALIDYNADLVDEVHPRKSGYDKMGELWFQVLDYHLRSSYFKYTIAASSYGNGNIDPAGEVIVGEGNNQVFSFIPQNGYKVESLIVDGENLPPASDYTFHNVNQDHTIIVSFTPEEYSVIATPEGNGSISPSGEVMVNYGENLSFTFTPDPGYEINDVMIDGESMGVMNAFTFENITSGHTLKVIFEPVKYLITARAAPNGQISPEGELFVNQGSSQSFVFTPSADYMVEDVVVDGESVGAVNQYTFENVQSDHRISVSFVPEVFTIFTSVQGEGSINPEGLVAINPGADQYFSFTPEPGWFVNRVLINDQNMGALQDYTFRSVDQNYTLHVEFSPITFSVIASAGENGIIVPDGLITVNKGSSEKFLFIPDEGFEIDEIKVDGSVAEIADSFVFDSIHNDHIIRVTFRKKEYIINTGFTGSGMVSPKGQIHVEHGNSQSFIFTPEQGKEILDVEIDSVSVGVKNLVTFENVTQNHSIYVFFTEEITGNLSSYQTENSLASIYPNPSEGDFVLSLNREKLDKAEKLNLQLLDSNGRIICNKDLSEKPFCNKSDIFFKELYPFPLNSGIYMLVISTNHRREVLKVIIQ